jgi:hypothetical protein
MEKELDLLRLTPAPWTVDREAGGRRQQAPWWRMGRIDRLGEIPLETVRRRRQGLGDCAGSSTGTHERATRSQLPPGKAESVVARDPEDKLGAPKEALNMVGVEMGPVDGGDV